MGADSATDQPFPFLVTIWRMVGAGLVFQFFEGIDQRVQMVPIDGANIVESKLMKQKTGYHEGLHGIHHIFGNLQQPLANVWHRQQHALHFLLEAVVDLPRDNAIEIARNGANVGRNRHLVVIQDD